MPNRQNKYRSSDLFSQMSPSSPFLTDASFWMNGSNAQGAELANVGRFSESHSSDQTQQMPGESPKCRMLRGAPMSATTIDPRTFNGYSCCGRGL
jgi:hypothetical protein